MSNRFSPKFAPIRFDPSGVFSPETGLSRDDQVALFPQLEAARAAVLIEMQGGKLPLLTLPERMLEEYSRRRHDSELGRILAAAKRMRDAVDRVIIIGDESTTLGARALFEACCHPYHNEQGRGDRGGRPRINFISPYEDNDALHGLIDLLETERAAKTIDRRWGIVAIDSLRQPAEVFPTLDALLPRAQASCDDDPVALAGSLAYVTCGDGRLAEISRQTTGAARFTVPEGAGHGGEAFSAVGLLPAAIMGIDVVRLLEGAATTIERFRTGPVGDNPAVDLAAVRCMTVSGSFAYMQSYVVFERGLRRLADWCRESEGLIRVRSFRLPRKVSMQLYIELHIGTARRDLIADNRIKYEQLLKELPPRPHIPSTMPAWFEKVLGPGLKLPRPPFAIGIARLELEAPDEGSFGQWMQTALLSRQVAARLAG